MPLSGDQAAAEILERREIVRRVREHMRDYPELNTLFDGVENFDEQIEDELDVVLDEINATPPPIGVLLAGNVPLAILIDGVMYRLLRSAAILYIRNDLAFSAEGVSVQYSQPQAYLQLSRMVKQDYESARDRWKVALNHQMAIDAVGGTYSDWVFVSRPSRFFYRDVLRNVPYFGL